jgi:hypothetical protein
VEKLVGSIDEGARHFSSPTSVGEPTLDMDSFARTVLALRRLHETARQILRSLFFLMGQWDDGNPEFQAWMMCLYGFEAMRLDTECE